MNRQYRIDYAKFTIDCEADYFQSLSRVIHELGRNEARYPNYLREHKITVWQSQHPGLRKYFIELWGVSACLVAELEFQTWAPFLTRMDVRTWEPDLGENEIMELGGLLQATVSKWNINVYKTRPATKREGRSRGGVGYAIGSHKSPIRVTTYKRAGEMAATEGQFTGYALDRAVDMCIRGLYGDAPTSEGAWRSLVDHLASFTENRIHESFKPYEKHLQALLTFEDTQDEVEQRGN